MYNVRLYKSTGFNAIDIPDSEALLNQYSYLDVSPIDTLQDGILSQVRIRASFSDVKDVDYAKIGEYFYSIIGMPTMASSDIAVLLLNVNPLLSAGGINAIKNEEIKILSGFTERISRAYTDITDPFIYPSEALELETEEVEIAPYESITSKTYIESTVDLVAMGNLTEPKQAVKYLTSDGNDTVTVPVPVNITGHTDYYLEKYDTTSAFPNQIANSQIYDLDNTLSEHTDLMRGIERVRGIGAESCILSIFAVPEEYVEATHYNEASDTNKSVVVISMRGKTSTKKVDIYRKNYKTSVDVRCKNILQTNENSYGILSSAGNVLTVAPYDIKTDEEYIYYRCDPHSDGKPYFGFVHYRKNNPSDADLWVSPSISGLQWKQLPLLFTKASGNLLNNEKYNLTRLQTSQLEAAITNREGLAYNDIRFDYRKAEANPDLIGVVADITGSGLSGFLEKNIPGFRNQLWTNEDTLIKTVGHLENKVATETYLSRQELDIQRRQDALAYGLTQYSTAIPQLMNPYNSETMRDFRGNGVIAFRYKFSNRDLDRIETIIFAFGGNKFKIAEKEDFYGCQNYDYVKADISVAGKPEWFNRLISTQLSGGVRIWHIKPDKDKILNHDNPILSPIY